MDAFDSILTGITSDFVERSERMAKAIREVYGDDPFDTEATVELDAIEQLLEQRSGQCT